MKTKKSKTFAKKSKKNFNKKRSGGRWFSSWFGSDVTNPNVTK
jgi:hypothetical protein